MTERRNISIYCKQCQLNALPNQIFLMIMESSKKKNYKTEQVDALNYMYDLSVDYQSTHYLSTKEKRGGGE